MNHLKQILSKIIFNDIHLTATNFNEVLINSFVYGNRRGRTTAELLYNYKITSICEHYLFYLVK